MKGDFLCIIFQVDAATNRGQIVCYCNHLTSFGSDLLVAPNPIDFDSVFSNFGSLAENVAVLALISTILGVYIIGVVWARRADKRDELLVGVLNTIFLHANLSANLTRLNYL
jgi:hypothetical protein